jgi:hypothetical protein
MARSSALIPTALVSRQAVVAFDTDRDAVIETKGLLFEGELGTQWVRVWLESRVDGIRLCSHDIGPALERWFGKDEIETFLEIDAVHVPNLVAALRAERTDAEPPVDAIELLVAKYQGDSTATSGLRTRLTAHGIPYRFDIV